MHITTVIDQLGGVTLPLVGTPSLECVAAECTVVHNHGYKISMYLAYCTTIYSANKQIYYNSASTLMGAIKSQGCRGYHNSYYKQYYNAFE